MAKSTILLLSLSVFTAHSAMLKSHDIVLQRRARSPCDICGPPPFPPHHGFPHPPPPVFHTRNWSGYARNGEGSQGVFSGAAAAAESGAQTSGQAFSLAASNAESNAGYGDQGQGGAGAGGYGSQSYKSNKASNFAYNSGHDNHFEGLGSTQGLGQKQQPLANGFGSISQAQAQNSYGNGQSGHAGELSGGRGDLGQVEQFGKYSTSAGVQSGAAENVGALQQQGKFGSSGSGHVGYGQNEQQQVQSLGNGGFGVDGSKQLNSYNQGKLESFGSGHGFKSSGAFKQDEQNLQQVQPVGQGFVAGANSAAGSSGGSNFNVQESTQSALSGALNLASQGLQTAPQPGCSTCGKSSYALSNAKSHSGNAVAVSVGG